MSISGKREPQLIVVPGRKGVGKTFETKKEILEYCQALKRKVLILDSNNEYGDFQIINCDENNIKLFSKQPRIEIRRVAPYTTNGNAKSTEDLKADMAVILKNFKGGLVLLEDVNRYVGDSIGSDLIGSIVVLRHQDCDIILHYQGIGRISHPKILMNTNLVRLAWTDDRVSRKASSFGDKVEILSIAEAIVSNKVETGLRMRKEFANKYPNFTSDPKKIKEYDDIFNKWCRFFLWISFDSQTIFGKFTKDEMKEGIFRYISENSSDVLSPELNKINRDGAKINKTPKEAIISIENRLLDLYWGN